MLTGVLIFIPGNVQLAAAILICVTAVASLHYFQPHRNRIVLGVAQVSFLMTTFKYVVAVVLQIETETRTTTGQIEQDQLGTLLIAIDVLFVGGCICSAVAVVFVLQVALRRGKKKNAKTVSGSRGYSKVLNALKLGQLVSHSTSASSTPPPPPASSSSSPLRQQLKKRSSFNKGFLTHVVSTHSVNQTKKAHIESSLVKKRKLEQRQKSSKDRLNRRLKTRNSTQQRATQEKDNHHSSVHPIKTPAIPPPIDENGSEVPPTLTLNDVMDKIRGAVDSPDKLVRIFQRLSQNEMYLSKKSFATLTGQAVKPSTLKVDMLEEVWLNCCKNSEREDGVDLKTLNEWLFVATQ